MDSSGSEDFYQGAKILAMLEGNSRQVLEDVNLTSTMRELDPVVGFAEDLLF